MLDNINQMHDTVEEAIDSVEHVLDQVAAKKGISSASVTSASVTPSSSSDVGSAMTIVVPAPTAAPTKDPVTIGGGAIAGMVVGCSVFLGVVKPVTSHARV